MRALSRSSNRPGIGKLSELHTYVALRTTTTAHALTATGSEWRTFEHLGVAEVSSIPTASQNPLEAIDPVDQP
jgi:hypothetical protein